MENAPYNISVKGAPQRSELQFGETRVVVSGRFPPCGHDPTTTNGLKPTRPSRTLRADRVPEENRIQSRPLLIHPSGYPTSARGIPFAMEWDNAAVVPISTYQNWWDQVAAGGSEENVRIARRRRRGPGGDVLMMS